MPYDRIVVMRPTGRLQLGEERRGGSDRQAVRIEQPVRLLRLARLDQPSELRQHKTRQIPPGTPRINHGREVNINKL